MGAVYIDVSQYQNKIDWSRVEADGVFIRVAYRGYSAGVIKADARAEENLQGAEKAGIPIGLYFMSQAISESEAAAEALYCLDIAKKYKVVMPIVFDCEYSGEKNKKGRADSLTKQQRTNMIRRFCDTVKEGGFKAGVYSSTSWYTSNLIHAQLENKGYFIWCAQYNNECKLKVLDWHLWQYTSKGKVNGIGTYVDLSKTKDGRKLEEVFVLDNSNVPSEASQKASESSETKIYVTDEVMSLKRPETKNARFYIGDRPTNFRPYEFACKNGADTIKVDGRLIKALQKIRDYFKAPVSITSAYRTEAYNQKVGGAKNSYHVRGMAADITVTGVPNRKVAQYASTFMSGVGLYDYTGGFVHVDVRGNKYFWQQDSKNSKYYTVAGFNQDPSIRPTLRYNDKGQYVKELQQLLDIKNDGIFKSKTEEAVRKYQKNHGLTVDGVVGSKTWSKLLNR